MAWMGWPVEERWHVLDDLINLEVGCHEWLEGRLRSAMIHSDEKDHPEWVMITAMTWRVIFKRKTAEKILAYIDKHRDELQAWDTAYNDAFNKNLEGLNDSGHVLIGHRGAPGPSVFVKGPAEEC